MKPLILLIFTGTAIGAYAQTDRSHIRQGNDKFEEGRYQEAEIDYRKALEKDPQSWRADYNLGNSLYKQKQFDAAAQKYAALVKNEKYRQHSERYYYNLGNAYFENKKYQESVESYKNALRNNPGDMDAKHNLQLAMRKLEESKQRQQQKQEQSQEQEREQEKKEQQEQEQEEQQQKGQQQEEQQQEQAQRPEQMKGQISREDAERILQALENEEKNVMKRVQEQKQRRQKVPLGKNW
jgi:tetratricopeptide (TPR) repeat protein